MRYAVYFLACLLLICGFNVEQVFSARKLTLTPVNCNVHDYTCGVKIHAYYEGEEEDNEKTSFPIVRRLEVLRSHLADVGTDINQVAGKEVESHFIQCLGKFCVTLNKVDKPDLRFSLQQPLVAGSSRIELKNGEQGDPTQAYVIPKTLDSLQVNYTCTSVENCAATVAAVGHAGTTIRFPFYNDTTQLTIKHVKAPNGVGKCFNDNHCVFLADNKLDFMGNFDGNVYKNVQPNHFAFDSETKGLLLNSWTSLSPVPQVVLSFACPNNECTMACKYTPLALPGGAKDPELTIPAMPIPSNFTLDQLRPIYQVKAKTAVATCAGYHCCIYDTATKKLSVNFKGNINANEKGALKDLRNHDANQPFPEVHEYSGVKAHKDFPVPSKSTPLSCPSVDSSNKDSTKGKSNEKSSATALAASAFLVFVSALMVFA